MIKEKESIIEDLVKHKYFFDLGLIIISAKRT